MAADPSSAFQEESQVLNICPPPNKKKYVWNPTVLLSDGGQRWRVFYSCSLVLSGVHQRTRTWSLELIPQHTAFSLRVGAPRPRPVENLLRIKHSHIYYLIIATSVRLCFRGKLSVWFPGALSESGSAWWGGEQSGGRRRRQRASARQRETHQIRYKGFYL